MIQEHTKYIIYAPTGISDASIRCVYNKIVKDLSLPKSESLIMIPFGWAIRLFETHDPTPSITGPKENLGNIGDEN